MAKGPSHTVVFSNSYIFAHDKQVLVEAKDRLVVIVARLIREGPGAVATMYQRAMFVRRAVPEAPHGTRGLCLRPAGGIKVAPGVQRSDELITASGTSVGKVRGPSLLQVNTFEAYALGSQ